MKILIYIIVGLILVIVYVRYLESVSIFYPTREIGFTPVDIGLPFEDVYFMTEDNIKLNGWLVKNSEAQATLVFFHGNAGNIGDRISTIQFYHDIGVNVFIIDYRGYGRSEGRPSEEGMYKDAVAAYDYLVAREDIDKDKIIGYGASLGGAAAIDLATKRPLAALIVDATFSNAADMAKRIYPFVPSALLTTKLDSLSKVKNLSIPKLHIHSTDDETVPFKLGKKLFDAAAEPKTLLTVNGLHDNLRDTEDSEKVTQGAVDFLRSNQLLER